MTRGEGTRKGRVAVGAVVLSMVAGGAVLVGISRPNAVDRAASERASDIRQPAATRSTADRPHESSGIRTGFSHDEKGAVSAATTYASATQRWLYFTDDEIRGAVAEISTASAAPALADEVVADVHAARNRLRTSPGRVWWIVRPLAWKVAAAGPDHATVAVWTVTVLSAEDVAAPQTEWLTVTVDLAWTDGDWRVDGIRDTAGPTPLAGPNDQPWDAVPFDRALAGFTRMDGEPMP